MPHYHKSGQIPHKRHTQFRKLDGSLYAEELFSTEGFADSYSLLYHCHPPTMIQSVGEAQSVQPKIALAKQLNQRSLFTYRVPPQPDYLQSRKGGDC